MGDNYNIVYYIHTLSNKKNIQKLLIETIGKILSKQDNIDIFIKENENKIIHIRDWINSIIENNEEWKPPRVLTLDALNNAADKYFEKKINKIKTIELDETHEKLIDDLGDYYIVKMLTAESLDNESKQMQHCIGQGYYDSYLEKEEYQYFSLRDKFNKAHVTLEIENNEIIQFQGKQNKIPETKYLEKIIPWLIDNNYHNIPWKKIGYFFDNGKWIKFKDVKVEENIDYNIVEICENLKIVNIMNEKADFFFEEEIRKNNIKNENILLFVDKIKMFYKKGYGNENKKINNIKLEKIQEIYDKGYKNIPYHIFNSILNLKDNKVYSIYDLPEDCEIKGDLNLSSLNVKSLPKKLKVSGFLDLTGTEINELPDNLIVDYLSISKCKNITKLPNNLTVTTLDISQTNIKEIPEDIHLDGSLYCNKSNIEKIPDNIKNINGELQLVMCKNLKTLPNNLTIKGSLQLTGCGLQKLPKGLTIEDCLYLSFSNITEIPNDLKIKYGISLDKSNIKELPDNFSCENIIVDKTGINMIKETMNFEKIFVDSLLPMKKEEFFKEQKEITQNNKIG